MDHRLYIPASSNTPEVDFDFAARRLSLRGESYPESAVGFYHEILLRTKAFLATLENDSVRLVIELRYFNSSSTKMLFNLVDELNVAAEAGNQVALDWYHDAEDDTMLEFGQELAEDFPEIDFRTLAIESP
ncbi:DUF1987 domain-containing protein [Ectothiorhodospira lacustris]|uniref:DUF1987 domain-containing protein n=1 Tax=Ectothiorhodospira lacustris TaxID=2899127 RepID=UPI001EE9A3E9|nr:DUF1987 domain-containing protein [Ectothiorhodospira lacustris]MCG5501999.1 DUF1987 domain-containing protein [Ectothiorhodospira lacustris]MCG5509522.1 DUF1987 domain-containing protein [Ectothiorhodospira lacustris]MCG5521683.1 DUF1987 domain-containing protein [Ectothiorhodospira lacustris]